MAEQPEERYQLRYNEETVVADATPEGEEHNPEFADIPELQPEMEAAGTGSEEPSATVDAAQTAEQPDQQEVETLRQSLAEAQEQVLRAHAEMQNVRRRSENEVAKARKFALERFARDLLPVVDSLEKAVESMGEKEAEEDPALEGMREGVRMTLELLHGVLGRFDIEVLEPTGQPFQPEFHEAMSMVPSAEVAPNTVMTVLQKGFLLNGRLLRPAMVMVSRAP